MSLSIPPDAMARLNMFAAMSDRSSRKTLGERDPEGRADVRVESRQAFRPEAGNKMS
ncbi:MAG TPA: hypothetical protein VHC19_25695 [Pirellulales bacterium]|jgi:hypothetical protein|nr:hypothetical protein [Pirellulales bacterium]